MSISPDRKRVVVITGASRGIGAACAGIFADNGDVVYSLSRSKSEDSRIHHIPADLTDADQSASAVHRILSETGRIDVLLLNAGIGISGSVEHTKLSDAKAQFDICYFGALRVLTPALPAIRRCGGIILFTSSVAAVTPIPFQAHYSACKAAINALCLALRNELRGTGVRVSAILPGDVKTGFTAARQKNENGSDIYPAMLKSVAKMEHDEQAGMAPRQIAKRMLSVSIKNNPKPFYSVGFVYSTICVLVKLLPSRLAAWVLGLMYAS